MSTNDKDRLLDHDADGIREFDNNLPRWWLYGFYLTMVFSVVYMVNYHMLETPMFGHRGQIDEYDAEVEHWEAAIASAPKKGPVKATLLTDAASLDKGKAIFNGTNNLCSTCHREDLGGQVGPNLTDDNWIHGCSLEDIMKNITTGFPEKGMLPYGSTNRLSDDELLQVASYVISRRGSNPADPKPIEEGRDVPCQ